jgi:tripartite-type tricarboxylate transporter receptor subunit TctC
MISAPAGTPNHIIEFWNMVYREIAKSNEVKENFKTLSVVNTCATVQQSNQLIKTEFTRISRLKHLVKAH